MISLSKKDNFLIDNNKFLIFTCYWDHNHFSALLRKTIIFFIVISFLEIFEKINVSMYKTKLLKQQIFRMFEIKII